MLVGPIINFSQSIVTDFIRENAEFQSKAGLPSVIVRKLAGGCCDWCRSLAGTYTYPDNVPKDVYRRHQRCRCTVDFHPSDSRKGRVQNVHSKKWRKEDVIEKYKIALTKQTELSKEAHERRIAAARQFEKKNKRW